MRHYFLILTVISSLILTGCSSDSFEEYITPETTSEQTKDINSQNVSINFSLFTMESMTRATSGMSLENFASHLDVWIMEGDNVVAFHQDKTQSGFSNLDVTLDKRKTYTLYAVGHSRTGNAELNNGVISFPDNKISNSVFYTTSFCPATTSSLDCKMKLIVGEFRFEITDDIPSDVAKFRFTTYNSGTLFNVDKTIGGFTDRVSTFTYSGNKVFSVYILASDDAITNFRIKVEALDSNMNAIQEREFDTVPIQNGKKTPYSGAFFIDTDFNITFTVTDWNEFETFNY